MNKVIIFCLLFLVKSLIGQAPQQISYQGVARNSTGQALANTTIAVKFDIHKTSVSGPVVFSEQHEGATGLTTNSFGLFTTFIGSINNLNVIDWSAGPFFIEVSIDPLNGTSYNSVGTQQFMSVPYALYAEKSGNTSPTPTITINSPNTVTNPATGSYSINIPSTTFTAGPGITINSGIITNSLPAVTPTLTGSGLATVSSPILNNYNINVTTPTLSVSGNTISINPGNSQILPTYSLSTGNANLQIDRVGTNYTITAVTPTLNVSGGSLTGVYPNQTLTIPNSSGLLTQGNNITLDQAGNNYTISAAATPSLTAGNSNIMLRQSGNDYTLTPLTPTLNVTGASLTGAYPSQTLTIPSSSTTLIQGNNVVLNQSGNAYTVSAVTPTLNVTGGFLTGAYPSQTLTIPGSSTTLVSGSNVVLDQSGNTYTVSAVPPNLTAGPNVTITPVGSSNAYTITAGVTPYVGSPGNISVSGNIINLINTGVPAGSYGLNASNSVPTFSVDNFGRLITASQYTPTLLGDVTGSINTSTVSKLRGVPVSTIVPVIGQVLQYSGSAWTPTTPATAWALNGNIGTTVSNFVGTTDNNTFHIRTNNLERANFNTGNAFNLFMGDNSNPGIINLNGNVSNSIKVIEIATANIGSALNIMAGDSKTGAANAFGGTLNLVSGAATGNTGSTIDFATASPAGSGSARSNPDLKMRLTETGQLLIGNTTGYDPNAKLITVNGHIQSIQTNGPTVTTPAALVSVSLSSSSTDVVGIVTISTPLAGLLAAGNYAKITFDKAYSSMPIVILTPTNASAAGIGAYVTATTLTDFTIAFSQSAGLLSNYTFNYIVLEGK